MPGSPEQFPDLRRTWCGAYDEPPGRRSEETRPGGRESCSGRVAGRHRGGGRRPDGLEPRPARRIRDRDPVEHELLGHLRDLHRTPPVHLVFTKSSASPPRPPPGAESRGVAPPGAAPADSVPTGAPPTGQGRRRQPAGLGAEVEKALGSAIFGNFLPDSGQEVAEALVSAPVWSPCRSRCWSTTWSPPRA